MNINIPKATELLSFLCNGFEGRTINDPVYRAVTEGRQDAAVKGGWFYSSCGDLGHAFLLAMGCLSGFINREEHNGWVSQVNVGRLCRFGPGTNKLAHEPKWGDEIPRLSILTLAAFSPSQTHVCVVVEDGPDYVITADYGQAPRDPRPTSIGAKFRRRQKVKSGDNIRLVDEYMSRQVDSVLPLDRLILMGPQLDVDAWCKRYRIENDQPPKTLETGAEPVSSPTPPAPVLQLPRILQVSRPYPRGDAVRKLQQRLVDDGYDPGPVDGLYGPRTAQAIQEWAVGRLW